MQTAVEKLFKIWFENEYISPNEWSTAIEIEKEQIGQAYMAGLIDGMNSSPKEYYTETYLNK